MTTTKRTNTAWQIQMWEICNMYVRSFTFVCCSLFKHKKSSKRMLIKKFFFFCALELLCTWCHIENFKCRKIKFISNLIWYDMMLEMFLTVITICFYVYCYFYVLCLSISVELRFFCMLIFPSIAIFNVSFRQECEV